MESDVVRHVRDSVRIADLEREVKVLTDKNATLFEKLSRVTVQRDEYKVFYDKMLP